MDISLCPLLLLRPFGMGPLAFCRHIILELWILVTVGWTLCWAVAKSLYMVTQTEEILIV
jgi:hypothetical protein